MKPFYSYTSNSDSDSKSNSNFIVFGINDAISVSSKNISTLQKCIRKIEMFPSGPKLFFNQEGPSTSVVGSDIYINCSPTGESDEMENVITNKEVAFDLGDLFHNQFFLLIMSSILFLIVIVGLHWIIKYISSKKIMASG
jgi:hypothetical protein